MIFVCVGAAGLGLLLLWLGKRDTAMGRLPPQLYPKLSLVPTDWGKLPTLATYVDQEEIDQSAEAAESISRAMSRQGWSPTIVK